jgi:hypothetical protein
MNKYIHAESIPSRLYMYVWCTWQACLLGYYCSVFLRWQCIQLLHTQVWLTSWWCQADLVGFIDNRPCCERPDLYTHSASMHLAWQASAVTHLLFTLLVREVHYKIQVQSHWLPAACSCCHAKKRDNSWIGDSHNMQAGTAVSIRLCMWQHLCVYAACIMCLWEWAATAFCST